MKKTLLLFCAIFCFSNCSKAQKNNFSPEALAEVLTTLEGSTTTFQEVLKKHEGKTIIIDIWASWCPDCIKGMPKMKVLQEQFPNAVAIFLSYDKTPEAWKTGIEKYKVVGEQYLITSNWRGGGFKSAVDIDWIPRYIVVDKTGKIAVYRAIEADDENLINTLKNLQ
jgi:thiol-disulfide isomerase/thioredoxin